MKARSIRDPLFVAVVRWCLAHGWVRTESSDPTTADGLTCLDWWSHTDGDATVLVVQRCRSRHVNKATTVQLTVDTVQAVADLLVGMGLLPPQFSTAYRTGIAIGRTQTYGEDLPSVLRQAFANPGQFCSRTRTRDEEYGCLYPEPLPAWGTRAAVVALSQAGTGAR